jgi:Putative Actinobacterial Holin-X, holin superfamily III
MATGNLDPQSEQAGQLISGVLHDARDLAVAEVDKLKAEAMMQVRSAGEGAKYGGAGLMLLTMAMMMLGVAIALGLAAAGLAWWLAFGLVAVAYGGGGAALLKRAQDRRHHVASSAAATLS